MPGLPVSRSPPSAQSIDGPIIGSAHSASAYMRRPRDHCSHPKSRVAPPPSNSALHSMLLNIECNEDEDVQWLRTETPSGRYVSGYEIVPRGHAAKRHQT